MQAFHRSQTSKGQKILSMHIPMLFLHEEILQAFHIDTKKNSPEIHPQKLCNKCLSIKRVTSAAQKKTPYKCSVESGLSIPWRGARYFVHSSTWPAVTCIRYISYRAAMVISHFIQHSGRRQESWEVLQLKLWNT